MKNTYFKGAKSYKLSIAVISLVIFIGFILQVTTGYIDFGLFRYPVNIFIGSVVILVVILFSFFRGSRVFRWFTGIPFTVTLVGAILFFCLFMGLIPQSPAGAMSGNDPYYLVGLRQITHSWPFVLLYILLLLALGMIISRRLLAFRIKDYAFYLNHIGLWILLFGAAMGATDMKDYTMLVQEGQTNSYGQTNNRMEKLPFSIRLIDFDMEEYPLDSTQRLRKMRPEPKSFLSEVEVTWHSLEKQHSVIQVNKPLRPNRSWTIYQYSYDYHAGKQSEYSVFKIVYDPWINLVYTGIILLAAGCVCMLWSGNKKNSDDGNME